MSSHLIKLGSFLLLELQIMDRDLDFGSHVGDRPKKNNFFGVLIYKIWPSGQNVYRGNCLHPIKIWPDLVLG